MAGRYAVGATGSFGGFGWRSVRDRFDLAGVDLGGDRLLDEGNGHDEARSALVPFDRTVQSLERSAGDSNRRSRTKSLFGKQRQVGADQPVDAVQIGDTISLHTEYGRYDYEVTVNFVLPAETAGRVLEQTADPTLVLTTCNPKYASSQRLIVEANLVDSPDT